MRHVSRRLTAALVVVRAWQGSGFAFTLAIGLAGFALVPSRPVPVPGREGVSSLLWPLVPVLPALAVPQVAGVVYREIERVSGKSSLGTRLGCAAIITSLLGLFCLAGWRFDLSVLCRNAAFLLGVALAGTVFSPSGAWLPVTVIPMVMWLIGTQPGGAVDPWAILLLPGSASGAARASYLVWITGTGFWLMSRRDAGGLRCHLALRSRVRVRARGGPRPPR
ncbi:MAG: hypothetical protein KatS3mg014_0341 [Actinomycetota bacterium]|nr:MAG: hypothetical protein KatS3mg014_0341 [Actinomycetota bacterium]